MLQVIAVCIKKDACFNRVKILRQTTFHHMAHAQAADVTWREGSRSLQEVEPAPRTERVSFDPRKPESSAWIQEILEGARCNDVEGRLSELWRFSQILTELLDNHGLGAGAECVSYFLQRGFLKELKADLTEARISGGWFLLLKSKDRELLFNRVVIYVSVLELMLVEERSARYIVKEFENLVDLLKGLFYQAAQDSMVMQHFKFTSHTKETDARRAIIRALSTLVGFSNKAKRIMAGKSTFFSSMIREATAYPPENVAAYSGLKLTVELYTRYNMSEQNSLLDDVLHLVAKCLTQSSSQLMLDTALSALIATREHEDFFSKVHNMDGLQESFIAIAACASCSAAMRDMAICLATCTSQVPARMSLFASAFEHALTSEQKQKVFERLADMFPSIKRRVDEIAAAANREPILRVRGFPYQVRRKCFGPACGKAEEKSGTFKMCRGCLLEIYCSAGEYQSSSGAAL